MGSPATSIKEISVVGLGKLGTCLAAVLAERGFRVVGLDINPKTVEAVNRGVSPVYEPGLERLIQSNRGSLRATTDYDVATNETQATFVVVPTPSDASGGFSLSYVLPAMEALGRALSRKSGYHLVALTSTVMPGSMDSQILPSLERTSGKKCGKDFGLCYNPEFIALGNVVEGLRKPDIVLVGESDDAAGEALEAIHRKLCSTDASVERMTFLNAEVTKIAVNAFVTMKMSFANTLAEISENLESGDVDTITHAMGLDKRIGPSYLKGATGYGGPCFPRDNRAFAEMARRAGVRADLAIATDQINSRQVGRIVDLVDKRHSGASKRVGILGLTYKAGTNVTEASQAVQVANTLAERGFEVHAYDPALTGKSADFRGLILHASIDDCLKNCDTCVITTPWPVFSSIDKALLSNKTVIDCWRILNGNRPTEGSRYITLGKEIPSGRVSRA